MNRLCELNILCCSLPCVNLLAFLINLEHLRYNELHDMLCTDFFDQDAHELVQLLKGFLFYLPYFVFVVGERPFQGHHDFFANFELF